MCVVIIITEPMLSVKLGSIGNIAYLLYWQKFVSYSLKDSDCHSWDR